jgi:hypothetical protein
MAVVVSDIQDSVRVDFLGALKQDASIQGTVTLDGEGAAGLAVTAAGPQEASAETGPDGTYRISELKRGRYTVTLSGFDPNLQSFPVTVQAVTAPNESPVTLDFAGNRISTDPDGLNLSIPTLYLIQSVQSLKRSVPVIANREGILRVFVLASEANQLQPEVRVEFFWDESLVHVESIPAPGPSVPSSISESALGSSWNVRVPASLIQPGLRIVARVDPHQAISEPDESDNTFPLSGAPLPLDFQAAPPFHVTFVPVRQDANDLVGDVSLSNAGAFMDRTLRMLPISQTSVTVHAEYTTKIPVLQLYDRNGAWGMLLNELDALRVAEGTSRYYYGVVKTSYAGGMVGMSYMSRPTAVGWDQLPNASWVAAHEWGHNWALAHAPGCDAEFIDPSYPYPSGSIGLWGLDVSTGSLKSPDRYHDFMGYCWPQWVSDFHFKRILDNREILDGSGISGEPEPSLMIWGRVEDDQIVLEPAFDLTTVAVLPAGKGDYLLEILGPGSEILFSGAFQPTPVADTRVRQAHFAFAVPLRLMNPSKIQSLRISAPGRISSSRTSLPGPETLASSDLERMSLGGSMAEFRWDTTSFPMVMIRDPESGEVLSLARGGAIRWPEGPEEIELIFSDGVRSPLKVRRETP